MERKKERQNAGFLQFARTRATQRWRKSGLSRACLGTFNLCVPAAVVGFGPGLPGYKPIFTYLPPHSLLLGWQGTMIDGRFHVQAFSIQQPGSRGMLVLPDPGGNAMILINPMFFRFFHEAVITYLYLLPDTTYAQMQFNIPEDARCSMPLQ